MSLVKGSRGSRVMIFIDIRNVLKSVDTMQSSRLNLDFYALAEHVNGGRELVGAYIFDSKYAFGGDDLTRKFHDKLRYMGFRVVARDSYDMAKGEQKEVDVAMACEMVVHALRDNYDVAVVVSGDRDFVPAVQHVQAAGKRVEVAAFSNSVSGEMIRAADRYYELEKLPLMSMANPPASAEPEEGP